VLATVGLQPQNAIKAAGMRQPAPGLSILHEPELLMLDEPLRGVDPLGASASAAIESTAQGRDRPRHILPRSRP
jgi:ABC-type transporter Mla maintaining outer membrane lipid asymmetry ATPase subunit MlaF